MKRLLLAAFLGGALGGLTVLGVVGLRRPAPPAPVPPEATAANPSATAPARIAATGKATAFPFDLNPEIETLAKKGETEGAVSAFKDRLSAASDADRDALAIRSAAYLLGLGRAEEADRIIQSVQHDRLPPAEAANLDLVKGWLARHKKTRKAGETKS